MIMGNGQIIHKGVGEGGRRPEFATPPAWPWVSPSGPAPARGAAALPASASCGLLLGRTARRAIFSATLPAGSVSQYRGPRPFLFASALSGVFAFLGRPTPSIENRQGAGQLVMLLGLLPQQVLNASRLGLVSAGEGDEVSP